MSQRGWKNKGMTEATNGLLLLFDWIRLEILLTNYKAPFCGNCFFKEGRPVYAFVGNFTPNRSKCSS